MIMKIIYQIPRNSLIWLLTAQVAVIVPHVYRIPWWLTAISLACTCWRVQVFRGLWRFPNTLLRMAFVLLGAASILYSYGTFLGALAGVALLIMAFSFKLLEMHTLRDAYIIVLLSYFVIAMDFLFEQSMIHALYGLFCFIVVTAALLGLNQSSSHVQPFKTFRTAATIFLQSLPLMIVLFILVPRFGPLWTLNFDNTKAYTGLSDSMSPGDIAQLSRSPKLAFRASFENEIPANQQLYWRTLVFYDFDGRTWRAADNNPQGLATFQGRNKAADEWLHNYRQAFLTTDNAFDNADDDAKFIKQARAYNYQVTMEPTGQNYLFALDMPFSQEVDLAISRDYVLRYKEKINQRLDYSARSVPKVITDLVLPQYLREKSTALPENNNPRSKALARQWREQVNSDQAFINKILSWFNQQDFVYTLRPPLLGRNAVDEFFFDTRRGFCAHYAGAFAFLLRSANIPARIVTGYQGGEVNALGNYVLVHQFDAHAWVEVWLQGRGWVRIDPTSAVSPLRIEQGIEDALAAENSFLEDSFFSAVRYRKFPILSQIRLRLDYINYLWHNKVVGYQSKQQQNLFTKWFGEYSYKNIALTLLISGLVIMSSLAAGLFFKRPKRKTDPATKQYLKFCKKLKGAGFTRLASESPMAYADRVSAAQPELKSVIDRITRLYVALTYTGKLADEKQKRQALHALRRAVQKLTIR